MDPTTTIATEDTFVLGRRPVNIFTFTTMAMRMSVYWSVYLDACVYRQQTNRCKQQHTVTNILSSIFFPFHFLQDIGNVRFHLFYRSDDDLPGLARLLLHPAFPLFARKGPPVGMTLSTLVVDVLYSLLLIASLYFYFFLCVCDFCLV